MSALSRIRPSRVLAFVASGVSLAVLATGVTFAATAAGSGSGYQACGNPQHHLALLNGKGKCPVHYSKVTVGAQGKTGPQGPSGVVSMVQYAPSGSAILGSRQLTFFGTAPMEHFTDSKMAALITGTNDQGSTDGQPVSEDLGICWEEAGTAVLHEVAEIEPEGSGSPAFTYTAATVSGVVGDLRPGDYYVGMCGNNQSANTTNGFASVTVVLAETAKGVTTSTGSATAGAAQPKAPK
jgi:hypothetical protein